MKPTLAIFFTIIYLSCGNPKVQETPSEAPSIDKKIEAITLLGDTLFSQKPTNQRAIQKFEQAKMDYDADNENIENIVWHGRRTAYLGRYNDAIDIYSEGIQLHPNSARLYRHRGHRYISTRQYDNAIRDFEKASVLIEGTENVIEQDGIPNAQNKPISSLHGNIYYHLGLAYYLKNDLENAKRIYEKRITTHQNDDNIVSAGHWYYMTLRRLGDNDGASSVLAEITPEMDIIENMHYHDICLFYKEDLSEQDLVIESESGSVNEVFLYGLGNWYLYEKQDTNQAKLFFNRLLDQGNKASFAFLAAEADMYRMKNNQ